MGFTYEWQESMNTEDSIISWNSSERRGVFGMREAVNFPSVSRPDLCVSYVRIFTLRVLYYLAE